MPEMFRESDHPRARGGKFRAKLAARARALRRAGRAKIAAHEAKERAKIRDFDARTAEKVAAYRSANPRANPAVVDDKARAFERARGHKKRILVATLEARLKGARQRVRAAVRYEHDAGKHASDLPAMERDYERYRRRRQGMKAVGDIKAAIARAKAAGPRKVDVHQDHLTGRTVSKRSKTGNPACSAAMSAWKLGRGTPEVHAMLARCRAMAAGRRQAELSRAAGNEARAQHLEHRSKQGLTGKDRLAKARELAEKRKAGRTEAPKADASAARRDRIERFMQSERFQKIRKHFTNKQGVDTAKVASERAKAAAALRERLPHIREARQDKKDEASRRAAWLERHKAAAKRGQKNAELVKDYLRKGGTASYSVYRSSSAPTRIVFNKPGHADLIEGADATGGILIRKGREVVSLTGPQSEMFTRPARLAKARELAAKRRAAHPPAQAEAPKLPTRTADTMSDAIAMSSPNGRMSKRAKAAATERLRVSLFGKEGLPQPSARQLSPTEADAQQAARLKELKEAKKRIKAGDARYDRLGVTGMANRGRARLERAARAAELRAKRKAKS